jgi:formylglycine-generating enzyme required for sulfatase activity
MKKMKGLFAVVMALAFILTACGTPSVDVPSATPEPPTATLVPVAVDTTVPTLVPVILSGPVAGSVMSWMDGGSLVYVPAGEFTMGSDGADDPRHTVSLSAYWISRTKITNRMYTLCVGVGVCSSPVATPGAAVYTNPAYADHPIVGVTWDQASAYCGWSGGRLPTEAEWEKAARGPGNQDYPWGNEQPSCGLLNFGGCVDSTTSVVAYPNSASPFGALDLAGNAFEWVMDWYDSAYYATSPIQDPTGAASGTYRVIRGSSFESASVQVASAIRHYGAATYTSPDLGFRCVVAQPINFPPYCQASPYQPVNAAPVASSCQAPVARVNGAYCQSQTGYNMVVLPPGTTYQVQTPGYTCVEDVVDGTIFLTCSGPDSTTGTITVCNSACGDPTPAPNQSAVCDPGYTYDPATRQCLYTPLIGQSGPQGCPPGYALDSTGQVCRPTLGLDNQCPSGQYFDASFDGCTLANGQANCNLYGLDNPSLAGTCYPGCPAGFGFDSAAQCCQAPAIGLYPDCQPGYVYDAAFGGCTPGLAQASGAGCATVSVDMLQCGPLFNCGQFTTETRCIQNQFYGCTWDDKANVCVRE